MSDQMLSLYELHIKDGVNEGDPFSTLPTRRSILDGFNDNKAFDLLVLGGGLTGALVAHEAALQGVSVLLLEEKFFGVDALSWDVRIAQMVRMRPWQLLRSKGALQLLSRSRAPHLVSNLIGDSHPIKGLAARTVKRLVALRNVDEELLIRETILAARQEGAVVLSSVQPFYIEAESLSGCYVVGFKDISDGKIFTARVGGIVVDPTHGTLPPSRLGTQIVPSPMPEQAGVQQILEVVPRTITSGVAFASFELTDGSFVSVAKRGLQVVEVTVLFGARPVSSDALQSVIQEACSEAGWTIQQELAMRVVAGKWRERYELRQSKGVFTCSHRGPWDAFRTATKIVQRMIALVPERPPVRKLSRRLLPGSDQACELDSFRAMARAQGIPERTIELAISRWRGRVRYIPEFANGLRELVPGVLRGEIDLSLVSDQAVTAQDVARGSLRLSTMPGWREAMPAIEKRFEAFFPPPNE
jgi:hypothetical protein